VIGIWTRIARLVDEGRPFVLCTVVESSGSVPRHAGARMLVFPDGSIVGSVGGAGAEEMVKRVALEALAARSGPELRTLDLWYKKREGLDSLCGGRVTVYIEPMESVTHVLLCGGGHIAHALARILEVDEYRHTVVDDRPEYASSARFPAAAEVYLGKPAGFLDGRDLARYSHVVLLGYSHELDLEMLRGLLPRFTGSVGVIGSRAKALEIRTRLIDAGLAKELVDRLRCPIGVDIGAESAAEIATSIAAEIVKTRRARPQV